MTKSSRILLQALAVGIGLFLIGLIATVLMYYHLETVPVSPNGAAHDGASTWLTIALIAGLFAVEIFLLRTLRRDRVARRNARSTSMRRDVAGTR